MDEVLFANRAVRVTSNTIQFLDGGITHALSTISSVHVARDDNRAMKVLLGISGLLAAVSATSTLVFLVCSVVFAGLEHTSAASGVVNGVMTLAGCGIPSVLFGVATRWAFKNAQPRFWLVLETHTGRVRRLSSKDAGAMEEVRKALALAMSRRP